MRRLFPPQTRSSAPRLVPRIAAEVLSRRVGGAAVLILVVLVVSRVDYRAAEPDRDDPPGSGIIARTEVTTIWVSQAFHDLTRREAVPPVFQSHEELRTYLERHGLGDVWYALTYQGYQVNGEISEITQVRRASEWTGHFEEVRNIVSTIAGKPPRYEGLDFSLARVCIIPESLFTADPREAVTKLMTRPDCSS
jgi:hypothetical protein